MGQDFLDWEYINLFFIIILDSRIFLILELLSKVLVAEGSETKQTSSFFSVKLGKPQNKFFVVARPLRPYQTPPPHLELSGHFFFRNFFSSF